MPAAFLVLASSCSSHKAEPVIKTEILRPALPPALKRPCAEPVKLPDRDLDAIETVDGWNTDRAALRTCGLRNRAIIEAIE